MAGPPSVLTEYRPRSTVAGAVTRPAVALVAVASNTSA